MTISMRCLSRTFNIVSRYLQEGELREKKSSNSGLRGFSAQQPLSIYSLQKYCRITEVDWKPQGAWSKETWLTSKPNSKSLSSTGLWIISSKG